MVLSILQSYFLLLKRLYEFTEIYLELVVLARIFEQV